MRWPALRAAAFELRSGIFEIIVVTPLVSQMKAAAGQACMHAFHRSSEGHLALERRHHQGCNDISSTQRQPAAGMGPLRRAWRTCIGQSLRLQQACQCKCTSCALACTSTVLSIIISRRAQPRRPTMMLHPPAHLRHQLRPRGTSMPPGA